MILEVNNRVKEKVVDKQVRWLKKLSQIVLFSLVSVHWFLWATLLRRAGLSSLVLEVPSSDQIHAPILHVSRMLAL